MNDYNFTNTAFIENSEILNDGNRMIAVSGPSFGRITSNANKNNKLEENENEVASDFNDGIQEYSFSNGEKILISNNKVMDLYNYTLGNHGNKPLRLTAPMKERCVRNCKELMPTLDMNNLEKEQEDSMEEFNEIVANDNANEEIKRVKPMLSSTKTVQNDDLDKIVDKSKNGKVSKAMEEKDNNVLEFSKQKNNDGVVEFTKNNDDNIIDFPKDRVKENKPVSTLGNRPTMNRGASKVKITSIDELEEIDVLSNTRLTRANNEFKSARDELNTSIDEARESQKELNAKLIQLSEYYTKMNERAADQTRKAEEMRAKAQENRKKKDVNQQKINKVESFLERLASQYSETDEEEKSFGRGRAV